MQLRPYQSEAVTNTIETMKKGVKRPLIIAPTASGKSIIIADIVRRCTSENSRRVLVLCHQGHLLAQNEEKINIIVPHVGTGIFCAGQGRKDRTQQVILASRDSLANNPLACGRFDLVICDEAHMIPINAMTEKKTNYGKIFTSLGCEHVIGLTGTPWRLSTGTIFGIKKFFTKVSYNIKMGKLIDEGFLSPYSFPRENIKEIDASNLTIASTGDYRTADLDSISKPDEIVEKCIDHWQRLASDRKCSIFFTCSIDHAKVVENHLKERIGEENVAYIDGKTKDRDEIFQGIVSSNYRAIVNVGVLTTGFDAPIIDCVVWLRATASASLFVQMGGRGLRISEGKSDCLMLDMAGNFERFYSIEEPLADSGSKKESEPKPKDCPRCLKENPPGESICKYCECELPKGGAVKTCKECLTENYSAATKCGYCGALFISHQSQVHTGNKGIFKYQVHSYTVFENEISKAGNRYCKIEFQAGEGWKYIADTYIMALMIYGDKTYNKIARSKYDKFKNFEPKVIQVYRDGKSKYPSVEVLEWEPKKQEGGCSHRWDFDYSPKGQKIVYCVLCDEMKEGK